MSSQTHIINKQVLDIKLNTQKDARLIQDTVSVAYKNYVIPVIERLADRYSGNGNIIKIDKLEIDIGSISIDKLNNDFPQKVERILEDTLIRILHDRKFEPEKEFSAAEENDFSAENISSLQIKSDEDNSLEILNYFLLTGTLPWWSNKDSKSSVQRIAEELLEKSPGKIKSLLLNLFKNQSIRKRFIYQFTDNIVGKTINIFIPSTTDPVTELINVLNKVQSYSPFIHFSTSEFIENTWEFVLQYIIENLNSLKNNQLNESDFIEYILIHNLYRSGKGTIYQRDFSAILVNIAKSINAFKSGQKFPGLMKLDSIIKILLKKTGDTKEPKDNITEASDLSDIMNDEKDSWKEEYFHKESEDDILSDKSLIKQNTDGELSDSDTINRIEPKNKKSIKAKTNIQKKSEKHDQKSDKLGKEGYEIDEYGSIIRKTDRIDEVSKIKDADKSIQDVQSELRPESEDLELSDLAKDKSFISDTQLKDTQLKDTQLKDAQLKDTDERDYKFDHSFHFKPEIESEHINNAGLVLLWPYLSMFFKRLNFVKDKQFISDETKYRAVHILQYLVTEQEETPEHELLFNKLLCGLDIYEPIPLGFKITGNEIEECNALLQSVINNWTVLKNTSIHGLRITFLQKEGILSKQSSGWKLNIERTTVDVLLDRLPWSISMIVLPWSNEMIYVEW